MKFKYRNFTTLFAVLCFASCGKQEPIWTTEGLRAINGTKLYVKTIGRGEPMIVVHGGPGMSHDYFLPQMAELAQDFNLIFYDHRVSGRSSADVDSADVSLQMFLADIDGLREAFGLEKINLLGHSWGGLLAMHYALAYPERLKSLILSNPSPPRFEDVQEGNKIQMSRFTPEENHARQELMQSEAFQNRDPAAIAEMFRLNFAASFFDKSLADSLTLSIPKDYGAKSGKLRFLGRDMQKLYSISNRLSEISCPTLIIHGAYDSVPMRAVEEIAEQIEGAQLEILKDCGHFPFIETPEPFFQRIRKFLSGVE